MLLRQSQYIFDRFAISEGHALLLHHADAAVDDGFIELEVGDAVS